MVFVEEKKKFLIERGVIFGICFPLNSIVEKFSFEITAYKSHKEFVEMKFTKEELLSKDNSLIHEQLDDGSKR